MKTVAILIILAWIVIVVVGFSDVLFPSEYHQSPIPTPETPPMQYPSSPCENVSWVFDADASDVRLAGYIGRVQVFESLTPAQIKQICGGGK